MSKSKAVPELILKRCKACGLCVAFCPRQVFEAGPDGKPIVMAAEKCTGCMFCEDRCPDFALYVVSI